MTIYPSTIGRPREPSKKRISSKKLQKKNIILPEIPSVAFELKEVIENPLSSAEHIARVVGQKPEFDCSAVKNC